MSLQINSVFLDFYTDGFEVEVEVENTATIMSETGDLQALVYNETDTDNVAQELFYYWIELDAGETRTYNSFMRFDDLPDGWLEDMVVEANLDDETVDVDLIDPLVNSDGTVGIDTESRDIQTDSDGDWYADVQIPMNGDIQPDSDRYVTMTTYFRDDTGDFHWANHSYDGVDMDTATHGIVTNIYDLAEMPETSGDGHLNIFIYEMWNEAIIS